MKKQFDAARLQSRNGFDGVRAHPRREQGVSFVAVAAVLVVVACNSPAPQSGTNTNWACKMDADCVEHEGTTCVDGSCVSGAQSAVPDGSISIPLDQSSIIGSLGSVVATDTGWIAVGYQPTLTSPSRSLAFTSNNGRDWTVIDAPGEGLGPVGFGNGTVVAASRISDKAGFVVRPPGGTWQFHQTDMNINTLLFGNGVFLATFDSIAGSFVSTDGVDWSRWFLPVDPEITFADGRFFSVMWDPQVMGTRVRVSTDGIEWSEPQPLPAWIEQFPSPLATAGDEVLGAGYKSCDATFCSKVIVSFSRGTETRAPSVFPAPWVNNPAAYVLGIAASATRVGILIDAPMQIWTTAIPRRSEAWQRADIPEDWDLRDIAYHDGLFVAVGQRRQGANLFPVIATSTDSVSWQQAAISQ